MNILVLNYEYPPLGGGAAPVSQDIARQLKKRGHNIVLLTMGYKGLPAYEEVEGVCVYRLKCWRKRTDACQPWEQFSYLMAVKRFMKNNKELQQYDVCHTHFVIPTGEAAYYILEKYHIPYIITAHGSDVEGHNKKKSMVIMHRFLRSAWKRIVNNAYCVVSPSIYLQELMIKNNSKGKYIFVPNGIETEQYIKLNDTNCKKKRILVMGRLQKFKNVQLVLRAISKIPMDGWEVDILGDGPYRGELEKLTEELGISKYVYFHGWVKNHSLEQYEFIKRASIYVSASEFENCPMSVIEAVLSGCYPILSDIPAHRQLIDNIDFFFDVQNEVDLANKLQERMSQGICSFEYNLDRLDWKKIIPKYEEILEKASRNEQVEI